MAHFFTPNDPAQKKTDFFHVGTRDTVYARLWNVGGPALKVTSDDVTTADVTTPIQMADGIWEFAIHGVKQGSSLIRARNERGDQWALTQAVVAAPAAGKGGPIYPTAAAAWKGNITFMPIVQSELPRTDNCGDAAHHLSVKFNLLGQTLEYVLIPHCVGPIPDCQVVYYVAWNKRDQMTEYAIPPELVGTFIENAAKYFVVAAEWFMFNGTSKYQIASSKAVYHVNQAIEQWSFEELKKCADALGMAWWEAGKDPSWWVQVLPAHLTIATPPKAVPVFKAAPGGAGAAAAADAAAAGAVDGAGAAPKGGLQQGKNIFPRPNAFQEGENILGRGAAEAGGPKVTPQALDGLRASPDLAPQQMKALVEGTLDNSAALKSLANGNAELALKQFTAETNIQWEKVPEGTIQKARPGGRTVGDPDVASLRTKEGFLQIEEQVFDDPELLKRTLAHDMAYGYVRGPSGVARLATQPALSALHFLEEAIKNGGKIPTAFLRLLGG